MKKIFAFEKSVGGVVIRFEGETPLFLLLRYRNGHWDFPKGHMEHGENETDTLKREIQEETGIADICVLNKFRTTIRFYYTAKGNERQWRISENKGFKIFKKVVYYLAQTSTEKVVLSEEHRGFVWLPFDQALKRITFKNGKNVLEKANMELHNLKELKEV